MRKNVASQIIGAEMITAADGSAFTGTVTVYVTGDGGVQAIGSVGSGICTHEGNGFHTYTPAQAETNYNHIGFTFIGEGAIPATIQVYPVSYDPTDTVRLGLTALPNAAADAAGGLPISDAGGLDLDAILVDTAEIGAAGAGLTALAQASVCLEARLAELDAANLITDVANVKTDTAAILVDTAEIGAAGAGLTALGDARIVNLDAAISTRATPAQVNTEVDTALADVNLDHLVGTATGIPAVPAGTYIDQIMDDGTAVYDRTTDSLQAIRDRGDAAWSAAAGTPSVLIDTTIAVVTDQTHFTLTAGSDIDDAYLNQAVVLYDASNSDYPSVRVVSAYTGATKTVTLDSAPDFTIIAGDGVKVFVTAPGTTAPTVGQIADGVWDELIAGHVVAGSTADTLTRNGKKADRNFATIISQ